MALSNMPRSSVVALSVIAIVAVSLSIISFQYASYNSQKIADLASNEIKTNSDVKAHDISRIIENKFDKVTAVLSTLATAPAIHNAEIPRGYDIINLRQDSTKEITDGIFWLDKDGKLIWSSKFAGNQSLYETNRGTDLSSQPYFVEPKKTGTTFYSSIIETPQKTSKLYIAMPIVATEQAGGSTETIFKGVIATGIKTEVLAGIVKGDLTPTFQSDAVLLDKTGTIMYSANQSSVGQNVFSPDYKPYLYSVISPESKDEMDAILYDLSQTKAGSHDMKGQQTEFTVSYSPVTVGGNSFLMLYIISPHTFTTEVSLLVQQQRTASAIIIGAIGAVAFGVGFLIVSWNHRLHSAVEERTKELKIKSEQLLAHDKLQREFINVAAHELRTPIQPLLGVTELIKQNLDGKDKIEITAEEVDMLVRNAKRLERLSSDILEVSRIESQTLKLNMELVNLDEKIRNVITDIKPYIPRGRNLEIIFEPKIKDPIIVEADKARLFEVLSNLLRNAIKFTEEGTIRITLDEHDGNAIITVTDTGKGIDPEIFDKLFTKFTTKSEQGTGLGLYLSKAIVEAHGGKIWAENNPGGKGSTFTFTLPISTKANDRLILDPSRRIIDKQ